MPFQGDVKSLGLANVFQDLAMNEQSGTLRLKQGDLQMNLWFDSGALRLVGFGKKEGCSVVNGLLALGKIAPADVGPDRKAEANVLRRLERAKKITRMDVKQALEHQMTEHVCDAFLWTEAAYEFREGDPDDESFDVDQIDLEPRLLVDSLVMEAARRADEWKESTKQIVSTSEVLVVDAAKLEGEDPLVRRIAALLDGQRSLRAVMEETKLGRFSVHKAAAQLLRSGAARPLKASEALERAQKHAQGKRWREALAVAQYGLDRERNHMPLRVLVARCHEELGDRDTAVAELRTIANAQAEAKDLDGALATYGRIAALAPKDTYAHERIFEILCALGRKDEALRSGEELAAACQRAGLPEKAREAYEKLAALPGGEDSFLESIAEIARRQGDKREANALYRKLLARALDRKDTAGALDFCRTMLRIDPANEEIQQVRTDLESGAREARKRRRRVLWIGGVGVAILALAGTAVGYEFRARSRFGLVRSSILDATAEKRWADALGLYDRVIDDYPWSLTARELRVERGRIEEKFAADELAKAEEFANRGQVIEAIDALAPALVLVRRDDLRKRMADAIAGYKQRRAGEEEQCRRQVAEALRAKKYEDLLKLDRPQAVPALHDCLSNPDKAVRDAAIRALGRIEHPLALDALVQALGDPDPGLRQKVLEILQKRTGRKIGLDRLAWENELRVKEPIRAFLQPRAAKVAVGEPVLLDWRVLNGTSADAVLEIPDDLASGVKVEPEVLRTRRGRNGHRSVTLRPGEFLGGAFEFETAPTAPGFYTISWSFPIRGRAEPVTATRVIVEVVAR